MKKTLLIAAAMLFSSLGLQAQTTTWDFTATAPSWPAAGIAPSGSAAGEFIDSKGLGLHGIASGNYFAVITSSSNASWAAPADAYAGTVRVQTNGGGYASGASAATPTQRYFFIQVNKACTVKVWFKSGSGGAMRSMIASDGATIYGQATTNMGDQTGLPTDGQFLNVPVNKAGTFYLYSDTAVNIYKIQVEGATVSTTPTNTLGTSNVSLKSKAKVYANGNQVVLSNVKGNNKVSVYSATGALVKTLNVSSDTSFEVNGKGVYIVTLNSSNGLQSEKVLVK